MTTTTATTSSTTPATTATTATSNSSLGASIISALGTGSGVDTDSLVTKLTAAQKASLEDAITKQQAANAAQVSATANIASGIAGFSSSFNTLVQGGTLSTQPTPSTSGVVTASALSGARLRGLNSVVTVTALATAQSLKATASGFPTSASGSITFTANGNATTVAVPAGTTLAGLVSLVNASGAGITASALTSGSTSSLVLKGATGTANAFSVSGSGDAALTGLSYDPAAGTGTMTATSTAANAKLTVDGVAIERPGNTINDAVAGVSLSLTAPGTTTLTATQPTAAISTAIDNFVSYYNALKSAFADATAAATSSTDAGALRGNATIRDMQNRLSRLTTTPLIANGTITTLTQLGIKTDPYDGTLSVDKNTLSKVLATYPDDVDAMFNPAQSSSSPALLITSKVGTVAAGTYGLTGITPAAGGAPASGSVNGTAMTGLGATLTAPAGGTAAGLSLTVGSGAPSSATLQIDLGIGGALAMLTASLTGSSGTLTAFQSRLKTQGDTLSKSLDDAERKLTVYHDRLVTQFSTMNTRVSAYKATQSYLTQQVDLWTKSSN